MLNSGRTSTSRLGEFDRMNHIIEGASDIRRGRSMIELIDLAPSDEALGLFAAGPLQELLSTPWPAPSSLASRTGHAAQSEVPPIVGSVAPGDGGRSLGWVQRAAARSGPRRSVPLTQAKPTTDVWKAQLRPVPREGFSLAASTQQGVSTEVSRRPWIWYWRVSMRLRTRSGCASRGSYPGRGRVLHARLSGSW